MINSDLQSSKGLTRWLFVKRICLNYSLICTYELQNTEFIQNNPKLSKKKDWLSNDNNK
jgi:hypothetical protein